MIEGFLLGMWIGVSVYMFLVLYIKKRKYKLMYYKRKANETRYYGEMVGFELYLLHFFAIRKFKQWKRLKKIGEVDEIVMETFVERKYPTGDIYRDIIKEDKFIKKDRPKLNVVGGGK